MAYRQIVIRYPDGTDEQHTFPDTDLLLVEPEGDWLHVSVDRYVEGTVKNFLNQDVPAPDVRIFSATVHHGHCLITLVDEADDA